MLGWTNNTNEKYRQNVIKYDNLVVWLDGTDFLNHGISNAYTILNGTSFNSLVTQTINNKSFSTYYKKSATSRSNGIIITPFQLPNLTNITMSCWGKKVNENNHNNLFTCGNTSEPFMEMRFKLTTNGEICAFVSNGTGHAQIQLNSGIAINTWNHFAISCNYSNWTIYYNGVPIRTVTYTNAKTSISIWNILGGTCWDDGGGE